MTTSYWQDPEPQGYEPEQLGCSSGGGTPGPDPESAPPQLCDFGQANLPPGLLFLQL